MREERDVAQTVMPLNRKILTLSAFPLLEDQEAAANVPPPQLVDVDLVQLSLTSNEERLWLSLSV